MRSVIGRPVRGLLLMVVFGWGALGCSGDALVSARADASSSSPDDGATLLFDAGSSSLPDGDLICTLIGCEDELRATVTVDATMVPAGTHTIRVTAGGTTVGSCTFPFPPPDVTLGVGTVEQCSGGLMMDIFPAEVCTTTQTATVSSDQCQPLDGKFTETLTVAGTPATVRVQQLVGATMISDQTISPTYVTNQPNGPLCGPTCHQAAAAWTIP